MSDDRDKVHISSYYDEQGRCTSMDVCLNYDGISREDLEASIRSLFQPGSVTVKTGLTFRHTELGGTRVIPRVTTTNGEPGPQDAANLPASATTTRMTISPAQLAGR